MELQAAIIRELLPLLPSPPDTSDILEGGYAGLDLLFQTKITSPPEAQYRGSGGNEIKRSFVAGSLGRLSVVVFWNSRVFRIKWEISAAPAKTSMLIQFRDPDSDTALSGTFNAGPLINRRWSILSKQLSFSPRKRWTLNLTIVKDK
jgi:hypothetical protein